MSELLRALSLSFAQLGDPAIVRVLVKVVALTLAIVIALGVGLAIVVSAGLEGAGFDPETYGSLGALGAVVLVVLGGWLLFRIVALAVMGLFAGEVVRAVELRHYPEAASVMREPGFARDIGHSLRSAGRALLFNVLAAPIALALLFTAIGPAVVFGLVNAVLVGRDLRDMVWLRHPDAARGVAPMGRTRRLFLGGTVTLMLLVPFLNLLAPIVGAASATHLVHREQRKGTI